MKIHDFGEFCDVPGGILEGMVNFEGKISWSFCLFEDEKKHGTFHIFHFSHFFCDPASISFKVPKHPIFDLSEKVGKVEKVENS